MLLYVQVIYLGSANFCRASFRQPRAVATPTQLPKRVGKVIRVQSYTLSITLLAALKSFSYGREVLF